MKNALVFLMLLFAMMPAVVLANGDQVKNDGYWYNYDTFFNVRRLEESPETSRTHCVGDFSDPVCTAETALACRTWDDHELCAIAAWPHPTPLQETGNHVWTRWNEPMFDATPPMAPPFYYIEKGNVRFYGRPTGPVLIDWADDEESSNTFNLRMHGVEDGDTIVGFSRLLCDPELGCPESSDHQPGGYWMEQQVRGCLYQVQDPPHLSSCALNPNTAGSVTVYLRQSDDRARWYVVDVYETYYDPYNENPYIDVTAMPGQWLAPGDNTCGALPNSPVCALLRRNICNAAELYNNRQIEHGQEPLAWFTGREDCLATYLANGIDGFQNLNAYFIAHVFPVTHALLSDPAIEALEPQPQIGDVAIYMVSDNLEDYYGPDPYVPRTFLAFTRQTSDGIWRVICSTAIRQARHSRRP